MSNLHAELRVHMRSEIATLHNRLGNTMVYVTHDQIEAMTLADKIVVLINGSVEQVGSPRELYNRPASVFVAQFIGSPKMNVVPVDVMRMDQLDLSDQTNAVTQVGMRPEHVKLVEPQNGIASGVVTISEYTGAGSLVHVTVDGAGTCLVLHDENAPAAGQEVGLSIDQENLKFFDADDRAITVT